MNVNISSKNNSLLKQEITALLNENNLLKEQLALLQEQFDWFKKQVFGRKTEQTTVIMYGGTHLSMLITSHSGTHQSAQGTHLQMVSQKNKCFTISTRMGEETVKTATVTRSGSSVPIGSEPS